MKGLTQAVGEQCVQVADLVDDEMLNVCSVITAALNESECSVREVICNMHDGIVVGSTLNGSGATGSAFCNQSQFVMLVYVP